ncbi:MAG: cytochrome C oxidase subunit IV family protein [Saprospiraceae bacterium]|nr:cytochrome C oxidase subunit IV family protein [Saprospiraceae bacterium]MBP7699363.1 cytochrome C oxidase subunit IV family protein [Saprospiraceae bacterium]
MAGSHSYEDGIKLVFKGLMILGAVTIFEVLVALLAKGHLIPGVSFTHGIGHVLYMLVMIGCSLYKAYFIIYEFMHMRYEAKALSLTVLLPMILLVWAIIAFFSEGNYWQNSRKHIQQKNEEQVTPVAKPQGALLRNETKYVL